MKRLTLFLLSLLLWAMAKGQTTLVPRDQQIIKSSREIRKNFTMDYYERLFYTCKVWGFVKYFHSKTANCSINLDSILLQKLPDIQASASNMEFNEILLELINSPGETAIPTVPLPVIPDSLKYNLNLEWIQNAVFSQQVKDALDTIRVRFRPRQHCLVGEAFANGNPTFDADILYNSTSGLYPDETLRILALFRYWNILNYFYPYKYIMDQDWDSTLNEVLPLYVEAQSASEYDKAIMVLAKRINDSHAFISGGVMNSIIGLYYPRFSIGFFENETVITKVSSSVTGIKAGDIIRSIDGIEIDALRDSLELYTHGSNDLAVSSFVHEDILLGPYGSFSITVENETGIHQCTLQRNWSSFEYNNLLQNTCPVWYDTALSPSCIFGYVDMGRLTVNDVGNMMNDLWETDAIIFDLRNYPQGTLWTLVNYLFTQPITIASFTNPDHHYPGVLSWRDVSVGSYSPEVYQGKLIILFDIRTLSQAEYTCMGLEQHPGSIKIGSQTKAADGNVSIIYLPGNITTYFTGLGTFYPDYTPTQRVGIVPDIEIWQTINGIRQGKDEVLGYAFNCGLVGTEKKKNSGEEIRIRPNPFAHSTRLDYSLSHNSKVTLEIHDLSGKIISIITDEIKPAGKYSVEFNGSQFPAGIYYYRFRAGDDVKCGKMVKL
jgi:carboxyl-terminal processing protease